jgi:mannan endo-1,4-beta-mannosidase
MANKLICLTLFATFLVHPIFSADFLKTGGSNFYYRGEKVFLSGVNFAWKNYGYDYGNGQYFGNNKAGVFKDWINKVKSSGGNTVRT